MTHYNKTNDIITVTPSGATEHFTSLPLGTYKVVMDPYGNYQLKETASFTVPSKIYGDSEARATRILDTFMDRKKNTGVHLTGEKGGGKTLLAELISLKATKHNISTIIVDSPYTGEEFKTFLQNITEPVIVLFDEFEKLYVDKFQQNNLLNLFDGVYQGQKLFLITSNDHSSVVSHMFNRPSRIYYTYFYNGLEDDFIREYCQDTLKKTENIEDIVKFSTMIHGMNFDSLKSIVEEMNRYGETLKEVLEHLNVRTDSVETSILYDLFLHINDKMIGSVHGYYNLMADVNYIDFYSITPEKDVDKSEIMDYFHASDVTLSMDKIKSIKDGVYIYEMPNGDDKIKIIARERRHAFDPLNLL